MNRKHNPAVALVAMALLVTILALICSGCAAEAAETEKTPDRFEKEYLGDGITIITDTQTGVDYIFYKAGYSGGLTVLQPGEE